MIALDATVEYRRRPSYDYDVCEYEEDWDYLSTSDEGGEEEEEEDEDDSGED